MATVYSEKYGGYIVDVPDIDFVRCDGKQFSYTEVNTANVSSTNNTLTINGGQGKLPLAYIDSDSSHEITFSSSKFGMDMFEMANATNGETKDVGIPDSHRYEVETGLKVTLPFEVQEGSVYIDGQEAATTASSGKYKVEITETTSTAAGSTEITFADGDVAVGDVVRIGFTRRIVNAYVVDMKTTGTTARGSLTLHYPVYSSGTDCTEASIKGRVHVHYYRVRATQVPGFDSSYKSASTNSVTFSAIDAQRPDEKMYRIVYEELSDAGAIVNTGSAATVEWN